MDRKIYMMEEKKMYFKKIERIDEKVNFTIGDMIICFSICMPIGLILTWWITLLV